MDVCAEQCDETCLMTAAGKGNLDIVEYLCKFGTEKLIMLQNKVIQVKTFFHNPCFPIFNLYSALLSHL
jgi:hypothetical protein